MAQQGGEEALRKENERLRSMLHKARELLELLGEQKREVCGLKEAQQRHSELLQEKVATLQEELREKMTNLSELERKFTEARHAAAAREGGAADSTEAGSDAAELEVSMSAPAKAERDAQRGSGRGSAERCAAGWEEDKMKPQCDEGNAKP